MIYQNGQGVAQDYSQARAWYQKAADQGYAAAQDGLGTMYYSGYGVAQDYSQARAWYQKAADQGRPTAQYNLGVIYQNGQGVAQDYSQARACYQKAADQGYAAAQENLGNLYILATASHRNIARRWPGIRKPPIRATPPRKRTCVDFPQSKIMRQTRTSARLGGARRCSPPSLPARSVKTPRFSDLKSMCEYQNAPRAD